MALPVNSNLISKKCGEVISSNCISYDGPPIDGLCKGASLTEAIYTTAQNSSCCEGNFPVGHQSCYTGSWVNFTPSVLAGSGSGYSYTISNLGVIGLNVPQYRWTRDGDLKLRGGFELTIVPSIVQATISIPLTTFISTCFPTGYTGSQFTITTVDPFDTNGQVVNGTLSLGALLTYPTGALSLEGAFINTRLVTKTFIISLGGITFNLA